MSETPTMAQKSPYGVSVTAGETYYWCACGKSKNQPFCDGTHRGSTFSPVAFKAEETTTVYLCGCKLTGRKPHCDGTHRNV